MLKTAKLGLRLNKMITPKVNKRVPNYVCGDETNAMPSVKSLTKIDREPSKRGIRRLAMLNKLFMKHITDIMATGTVSIKVVGRGIEISKVKVSQDYKFVSVYYVDKSQHAEDDTETVLTSIAGLLRHELSILKVMGNVPRVVFVKDREESLAADVNRLLAIADYGEDYTPKQPAHFIRTELISNTKLSPDIKAKIKQLDESEHVEEEPLPEMTNSVYGLEHEKIMKRLLACRTKNQDAWENLHSQNKNQNVISYRTTDVKGPTISENEQKKELADFLIKRQIARKNALKQRSKNRVAVNSYAEYEEPRQQNYSDNGEYREENEYMEEEMRRYEEELRSKDYYEHEYEYEGTDARRLSK